MQDDPISNPFKRMLRTPGRTHGLWCSISDPTVAEILSLADPDWILLDLEHTAASNSDALSVVRAVTSCPVVVRVGSADRPALKQLLDAGVQSVLIPQIGDVDEARAAIAACHYPPHGVRGVAGSTRAAHYGLRAARLPDIGQQIAVVLQIETRAALEDVAAIAALDRLDGLLVGPADLAAALGCFGDPMHPTVQEAIGHILDVGHAAGLAVGIYAARPDACRRYAAMGFDFLAVGHDSALLIEAARACISKAREA